MSEGESRKRLRLDNGGFSFLQFRMQTFFVRDKLFKGGGMVGIIGELEGFTNIDDMFFVVFVIFCSNAVQVVFDTICHEFAKNG